MRTVGASDVPVILGWSPWGSVWSVWSRLQGLTDYDDGDTPATARGKMLEAALLVRYGADLGVSVMPGPPLGQPGIQGPEPWMHARPDGYAQDAGATWLVEAKTSRYLDAEDGWGEHGTDEVPRHYRAQVAWQMMCTGADRCDLVAFGTVRDDFRIYIIRRHEGLEAAIRQRVSAWYGRHVGLGDMPEVDGSGPCREALAMAWQGSGRPDREATPDELALLHQLSQVRDALDQLSERRRSLEAQIQRRMGPAGRLLDTSGRALVRWTNRKGSSRIDVGELRRRNPELAAQLTQPGKPGRTFKLTREDRS